MLGFRSLDGGFGGNYLGACGGQASFRAERAGTVVVQLLAGSRPLAGQRLRTLQALVGCIQFSGALGDQCLRSRDIALAQRDLRLGGGNRV